MLELDSPQFHLFIVNLWHVDFAFCAMTVGRTKFVSELVNLATQLEENELAISNGCCTMDKSWMSEFVGSLETAPLKLSVLTQVPSANFLLHFSARYNLIVLWKWLIVFLTFLLIYLLLILFQVPSTLLARSRILKDFELVGLSPLELSNSASQFPP